MRGRDPQPKGQVRRSHASEGKKEDKSAGVRGRRILLVVWSELAADEGLEDALRFDVGVGEAGGGDDEGGAGEEEAGGSSLRCGSGNGPTHPWP